MVSGTVSDMYRPKDRGTGMNVFTVLNFGGQVCAPMASIAQLTIGAWIMHFRLGNPPRWRTMDIWSECILD